MTPVLHLTPMGRLGNIMIQYMVALSCRKLVKDCTISGISLPAWGIDHPAEWRPGEPLKHDHEQFVDLQGWAKHLNDGMANWVHWVGFGQRLEYFPPLDECQSVFRTPPSLRGLGYGPHHLVCPVRAEDIVDGSAPDYPLTPVEFYRGIVAATGLTPVFIGQTEPNAYTTRLRAAFPSALVRAPQRDPLVDFETIRQSRNIAIGVSTYAWLAAWLSETADTVFMAVSGLFNPMQKPSVNLLPYDDRRFRFILFPINYATPIERHAEVHARIAPFCREVPHASLRAMQHGAPRFELRPEVALEILDEAYYLAANRDVAEVARVEGPDFARRHYSAYGFNEGRSPIPFDVSWYAARYPLAAAEVSQGDYRHLLHHYLAIGRQRGYQPQAPARGA